MPSKLDQILLIKDILHTYAGTDIVSTSSLSVAAPIGNTDEESLEDVQTRALDLSTLLYDQGFVNHIHQSNFTNNWLLCILLNPYGNVQARDAGNSIH